jgi:hypothetical protein
MAVSSPTPSATAVPGNRRRPSSARSARSAQSTTTIPTVHPTSAKAAPLARRLLFPTWAADQPLPVLLGPADDALDAELYDFVALALRAFVHPWWSKLTRFDRDLLPRVTAILAHVLRALTVRLQAADLPALVCLDAPALLAQHVRDYRAAAAARGTAYGGGGGTPLAQLFHQRQAHIAVGADGVVSDEYVRCAVDHILRVCLPAEDCAPETERTIVREIVLMIVLRSVVPKVTQPWFIHKMILDQLGLAPSAATVVGLLAAVSQTPSLIPCRGDPRSHSRRSRSPGRPSSCCSSPPSRPSPAPASRSSQLTRASARLCGSCTPRTRQRQPHLPLPWKRSRRTCRRRQARARPRRHRSSARTRLAARSTSSRSRPRMLP